MKSDKEAGLREGMLSLSSKVAASGKKAGGTAAGIYICSFSKAKQSASYPIQCSLRFMQGVARDHPGRSMILSKQRRMWHKKIEHTCLMRWLTHHMPVLYRRRAGDGHDKGEDRP